MGYRPDVSFHTRPVVPRSPGTSRLTLRLSSRCTMFPFKLYSKRNVSVYHRRTSNPTHSYLLSTAKTPSLSRHQSRLCRAIVVLNTITYIYLNTDRRKFSEMQIQLPPTSFSTRERQNRFRFLPSGGTADLHKRTVPRYPHAFSFFAIFS